VSPPGRVRRVVSLVPSLTEAIAETAPGLLAGATDWCTHPAGLDVVRVRGTKNPDTDRIIALEPDLVVANFEENRPEDLEILRAAGIPVWVTVIRTLPEALSGLGEMLAACGLDEPPWLTAARAAWADVLESPPPASRTAVVPIWRRPWMVLGRETFAGDVLARLGVANLYADDAERYPKVPVDAILRRRPDMVVLPDEPYAFAAADGPEAFPGLRVALVSGRHLEWYGPSLTEARQVLTASLESSR
jgi:ABC-type Fe3+-hydroxamate transport system substrate-binding protein